LTRLAARAAAAATPPRRHGAMAAWRQLAPANDEARTTRPRRDRRSPALAKLACVRSKSAASVAHKARGKTTQGCTHTHRRQRCWTSSLHGRSPAMRTAPAAQTPAHPTTPATATTRTRTRTRTMFLQVSVLTAVHDDTTATRDNKRCTTLMLQQQQDIRDTCRDRSCQPQRRERCVVWVCVWGAGGARASPRSSLARAPTCRNGHSPTAPHSLAAAEVMKRQSTHATPMAVHARQPHNPHQTRTSACVCVY
jgi:hypothetical protein